MAKKRKASGRDAGPKEVDAADARLGPISTFEDVANSEDEYFLNQDRIMLDDEPDSKRRRSLEEDDIEFSDEEILGYEDSDSDDQKKPQIKSKESSRQFEQQDDKAGEDDEADGESGWWGSSRQEYYDADNIETEADALEEEAEARRLQQKKLSKMREEDFTFDGDEWLAGKTETDAEDTETNEKVVEVLKDIEVTPDMTAQDKLRLLSTQYPEFEHLAAELELLQPVLLGLQRDAADRPGTSIELIKYWTLGCYVATLTSYFALLTSSARDGSSRPKALPPSELRDHDVMETLLNAREAWDRVKNLKSASRSDSQSPVYAAETGDDYALNGIIASQDGKKVTKDRKEKSAKAKALARRIKEAEAVESTVADLYNLPILSGKSSRRAKLAKVAQQDDDDSDFGEEDALDARTAAEKAARKKSLKFYTSQIAQKANKRAGAGRDAGGDVDIPHRERLRDRQARLLAEAEKRGKKGSKHGADLGDESDGDDDATANAMRGDEDEYYDMVAQKSKNKRDDKAARYAAYAAASKTDRVVETEELGEDGKRKITYAIEKNKGLAPKRGKDVRNPRVKKRKQYEAKMKKLKSMKPVWQGGEPKGGYRGELSGINTGVVKSVKL
ncbi:Sas10/Utp3 family protein [Moelleriella libera RCEF 2490]|uniref:Sas10/Utp3 family protein n=1 Tax=Moelleriella libera RCEF 2490 TaxID=1081109 RepID=A0A166U411_9HYPO|nr:Sas10/Utp3 family protein [Moelleriella libera RCEF 2490]